MDAFFDWQLVQVALAVISISFLLILIDVLFIPTSILSIFSVMAFLSYVVYLWQNQSAFFAGLLFLIYAVVILLFFLLLRHFKLWEWFQLRIQARKADAAGNKLTGLMHEESDAKTAFAYTDLRPSGSVELGKMRYDAISADGLFIKKGEKVYVHGRSLGQLLVSRLPRVEKHEKA